MALSLCLAIDQLLYTELFDDVVLVQLMSVRTRYKIIAVYLCHLEYKHSRENSISAMIHIISYHSILGLGPSEDSEWWGGLLSSPSTGVISRASTTQSLPKAQSKMLAPIEFSETR